MSSRAFFFFFLRLYCLYFWWFESSKLVNKDFDLTYLKFEGCYENINDDIGFKVFFYFLSE